MRLKYIDTCSFQRSEATNFADLKKKNKWVLLPGEVACLVSMTGDQLVFVYGHRDADPNPDDPNGVVFPVVHSERLRLSGRQKWNPMMLANYAAGVGMKLEGLKRFEEHYR